MNRRGARGLRLAASMAEVTAAAGSTRIVGRVEDNPFPEMGKFGSLLIWIIYDETDLRAWHLLRNWDSQERLAELDSHPLLWWWETAGMYGISRPKPFPAPECTVCEWAVTWGYGTNTPTVDNTGVVSPCAIDSEKQTWSGWTSYQGTSAPQPWLEQD